MTQLQYILLAILCGLCLIGSIFGSFYVGCQFCLAGYSFWYLIGCLYAGMAVAAVFGHLLDNVIGHIK